LDLPPRSPKSHRISTLNTYNMLLPEQTYLLDPREMPSSFLNQASSRKSNNARVVMRVECSLIVPSSRS
jgi:hypothetical protein